MRKSAARLTPLLILVLSVSLAGCEVQEETNLTPTPTAAPTASPTPSVTVIASPDNATATASYVVRFTTKSDVAAGGVIGLKFPPGVGLPTMMNGDDILLRNDGSLVSLEAIDPIVSGQQVIVTIPQHYLSHGECELVLPQSLGILNPPIPSSSLSEAYRVTVSTSEEPSPKVGCLTITPYEAKSTREEVLEFLGDSRVYATMTETHDIFADLEQWVSAYGFPSTGADRLLWWDRVTSNYRDVLALGAPRPLQDYWHKTTEAVRALFSCMGEYQAGYIAPFMRELRYSRSTETYGEAWIELYYLSRSLDIDLREDFPRIVP